MTYCHVNYVYPADNILYIMYTETVFDWWGSSGVARSRVLAEFHNVMIVNDASITPNLICAGRDDHS